MTLVNKLGLGLAIVLLLCLLPMPYGYYIFVRYVTMVILVVIGIDYFNRNNLPLGITALAIALLFQPFFKIPLGRLMWNIVDVLLALALLTKSLLESKNKK